MTRHLSRKPIKVERKTVITLAGIKRYNLSFIAAPSEEFITVQLSHTGNNPLKSIVHCTHDSL